MKINRIIYTAAKLQSGDIIPMPPKAEYPNRYAEHVTIQFGFEGTELPDYIGEECTFVAMRLRRNSKASALYGRLVDSLTEANHRCNHPAVHMTIATAEGIKPFYCKDGLRTEEAWETACDLRFGMILDAFCVFADGTTGWVSEKRAEEARTIADLEAEGYDPIVDL